MKKFHILYKTTNNINNKIYIGVHSTDNLEDGYLGSGVSIGHAIRKYGISNFSREIIEYFENPEDMYKREEEIVNEEFIDREDNYNISLGGRGFGLDVAGENNPFYGKKHSNSVKTRISECAKINSKNMWSNLEFRERMRQRKLEYFRSGKSDKLREILRKNLKYRNESNNPMNSIDVRKKVGVASSRDMSGRGSVRQSVVQKSRIGRVFVAVTENYDVDSPTFNWRSAVLELKQLGILKKTAPTSYTNYFNNLSEIKEFLDSLS